MDKNTLNTAIIFGIPLFGKSRHDVLKIVQKRLKKTSDAPLMWVNTPNAEQVVQAMNDDLFRSCLNESTLNLPDGVSVVLATRLLSTPRGVLERISGVDMMEDICRVSSILNKKLFLLGGRGMTAEHAAQKLRSRYSGIKLECDLGSQDVLHETKQERARVLKKIEDFGTEVLFVGYGAPKQELWVKKNKKTLEEIGVKIVMVVGGAYDMISGTITRAPRWVQRLGMEWLWRLVQEPWRWKRQLRLVRFWGRVLEGLVD